MHGTAGYMVVGGTRVWGQGLTIILKVSGIISGLNAIVLDRAERNNKARVLAQYLVDNLNTHNIWAIKIFITEIIYFLNVILNLYFIDVFLGDYEVFFMR